MATDGNQFDTLSLTDLRDHPNRLTPGQRIALVRADQRRAWTAGQRTMVEELLMRYPALAGDAEAIIDLAYSEFMLRGEAGEKADPDEYCRRFPDQAQALRRQLALHAALQQMTFTSVDALASKPPASSQTIATGPPVFDSLPPTSPPPGAPLTVAAEAAEAFQTLMQAPANGSATVTSLPPPVNESGEVSVPGYEILSELGRGGMGVVYKARQHRLDRLVALKMILSGEFASKIDRDRFREEAVKLARVQHPNIVQIYEVSEYENRPYFAMEYLDGGSLVKEIAGQPLTPRIAARLILSLANAMHAAHEKGIVHRDLKPGNILLTAGGLREASERGVSVQMSVSTSVDSTRASLAKITDFGLAKGMTGEESRTVSGAILGTPSYMAPEQARGQSKNVGPAADIYALGAILYECLTGRPPFLAPNAIDTIYLVVHEEPVKPSAWDPKIPQDLETICLKCLEKAPEKRYLTAKLLAEDLECYLEDRPIRARPVGSIERTIKWAKRRPAQAALAGTIAVGLIGAITAGAIANQIFLSQRNEAREARDIAQTERIKADEARDEKEKERKRAEDLKELAMANERTAKDEEKKAKAAAEAERLAKEEQQRLKQQALIALKNEEEAKKKEEAAKLEATKREQEALVAKAETEKMFGYARDAVNQYFTAVSEETLLDEPGMDALRKKLLEQASRFYEQFDRERGSDARVRGELADALFRLAKIKSAVDLKTDGIKLFLRTLDLYRKLYDEKPSDQLAANVAQTFIQLGILYRSTKQEAEAINAGLEAVGRWDALACKKPDDVEYQAELARSLHGLGGTYADFKHYDLARARLKRALAIRKMLADGHSDRDVLLRDLAVTLDAVATVAAGSKEFSVAEQASKDALAICEQLVKKMPERTVYRDDLGRYLLNLGNLYLDNNEPKLAADSFGQAARSWEELSKTHPDVKQFRFGAGRANRILSDALIKYAQSPSSAAREKEKLAAESLAALEKARGFLQRLVQEDPNSVEFAAELARVEVDTGNRLLARRAYSEAVEAYQRGVKEIQALFDKNKDVAQYKIDLANALYRLGHCLRRSVRRSEGRPILERSRDLWEELVAGTPGENLYRLRAMLCLNELGQLELRDGDGKKALTAAERCMVLGEIFTKAGMPAERSNERYRLRDASAFRALALEELGRNADARAEWNETVNKWADKDEKPFFKLYLRAAVACTADYPQAVKEAKDRPLPEDAIGLAFFLYARTFGFAARTAADDAAIVATERQARSSEYAALALQYLQKAERRGYFADPDLCDSLRTDKVWTVLRGRNEFQQLINSLIASRNP